MAQSDPRLAQIALMWYGEIGPAGFRRLVGHFGDPAAVLAASEQELAYPSLRLEPEQIKAIAHLPERLGAVSGQIEELHGQNIRVLCDFDPEYPEILVSIPNRPPVLSLAGRLLPTDDPAVAIVGTRKCSQEGYQMAQDLARAFARQRITVVGGLAAGCDTGGHRGALAGDGRTLAVLGSGILVVDPTSRELALTLVEHGALLSEQSPHALPDTPPLMARNRLQSGLARAVIVVESAESGGAMETAQTAQRQRRLRYAVRWPTLTTVRAGNAKLLAEGARPISGPGDVAELVEMLYLHRNQMRQTHAIEGQQQLFPE